MELFNRFVEALQKNADRHYGGSFEVDGTKGNVLSTDNSWIKNQILERLEETSFFILTKRAIFGEEQSLDPSTGHGPSMDLDVAPPLKTCWFQMPEGDGQTFKGVIDFQKGEKIYGLWIHETGAHEYLYCIVLQDINSDDMLRFRMGTATQVKNHEIWHTIALWLQPFGKSYTGATKKVSDRVKFKDPKTGEKKLHKIRRVIMVYPKEMLVGEREEAEKDGVDFTYRFEIRAHWRRLFYLDKRTNEKGEKLIDYDRIGKNREEEYCVAGFTYVEEGVKGPEHLPLIKKTRVVHGKEKVNG